MKVAVIITTYNGEKWLEACLKSVFASTIPVNVVVVDNFSTDKTSDIVNKFPEVTLVALNENSGFGNANNVGISYALNHNMDYVFLLNQDAYLEEITIEKLIQVSKDNTEFGVLSPVHLNGKGSNLDLNFSNYIQKNKTLVYDALKGVYTRRVYQLPFVNAAGWLVSKETFKSIGGFDPIFKHYGEDVNYCQRLNFHGFNIGIVPKTYLYHDREERLPTEITNQKEKLNLIERQLKVKWANINQTCDVIIKNKKTALQKAILKQCLQLKFKTLWYCWEELKLINAIIPEIKKSRALNVNLKPNYLNFKKNRE